MLTRATLIVLFLLAGCTQADSTSIDRFSETGQLIALSGARAGADNACFTCHGLDGRGDGAGSPRLAGLEAGYLERQLIAYANGRRQHTQMSWISRQLRPAERRSVAQYYGRMNFDASRLTPAAMSKLYHLGDPSRGIVACASCHGPQGGGFGAGNPPLAGQPAPYLAHQLELWRAGKRRTDPGGVMLRISQLLTPSESRALAAYAGALSGDPSSSECQPASPERHADPKNGASGPPLHVPESARAAK